MKPDYLAYRLIDAAIDGYFPVLETVGNKLTGLMNQNMPQRAGRHLSTCTTCRTAHAARAIWPFRDAIGELHCEVTPFVADTTQFYPQLLRPQQYLLESYRDIAAHTTTLSLQ